MRVLLLGGSTEASGLAMALASDPRFDVVLSLAGRTAAPRAQPTQTRSGGFGGVGGLVRYLQSEGITILLDATHPFATQMSRNAIEGALIARIPLLAVERPPWEKQSGDRWIEVQDIPSGVRALGSEARRVFCGIGSLALRDLQAARQHSYIIRLIDAPPLPLQLPNITLIRARGPFSAENDIRLFQEHRIEVILAKNSGGSATVSKIAAARALALPVIMVERPLIPPRPKVATVKEALIWLDSHYDDSMLRGV
jgi:precorrin-6A/cobalt-precorrin-6A reductase